jgi:hypothetical protein
MSSLHIDPIDPYPDFIPNSESLMRSFAYEAVSFLMIMIIVIMKARHSDQSLYKNIL